MRNSPVYGNSPLFTIDGVSFLSVFNPDSDIDEEKNPFIFGTSLTVTWGSINEDGHVETIFNTDGVSFIVVTDHTSGFDPENNPFELTLPASLTQGGLDTNGKFYLKQAWSIYSVNQFSNVVIRCKNNTYTTNHGCTISNPTGMFHCCFDPARGACDSNGVARCINGWSGISCEIPLNGCYKNLRCGKEECICSGRGTRVLEKPECQCSAEYFGNACEYVQSTDICNPLVQKIYDKQEDPDVCET
jgi:hypothetical protein